MWFITLVSKILIWALAQAGNLKSLIIASPGPQTISGAGLEEGRYFRAFPSKKSGLQEMPTCVRISAFLVEVPWKLEGGNCKICFL